ncbi:PKD domain-containing protein, partial [Muricauda sp. 2012CJ35-5]
PPVSNSSANLTTGDAPLTVDFTGDTSTDDVAVIDYLWDFKDGNTSTLPNPSHTFNAPGTYNVELTVQDQEGLSDSSTVVI